MSRVGNKIIRIPDNVTLTADGTVFAVKGPLGQLQCQIPASVQYKIEDGVLSFSREGNRPQQRSDHGLARALVNNLVLGVTGGFKKVLELEGTGYKWEVRGDNVAMTVGYSHQVLVPIPAGIKVEIKGSQCEITGIDKQLVGFIAAQIRRHRPVEPYKGKGIRYQGQFVRRKAGKTGA